MGHGLQPLRTESAKHGPRVPRRLADGHIALLGVNVELGRIDLPERVALENDIAEVDHEDAVKASAVFLQIPAVKGPPEKIRLLQAVPRCGEGPRIGPAADHAPENGLQWTPQDSMEMQPMVAHLRACPAVERKLTRAKVGRKHHDLPAETSLGQRVKKKARAAQGQTERCRQDNVPRA